MKKILRILTLILIYTALVIYCVKFNIYATDSQANVANEETDITNSEVNIGNGANDVTNSEVTAGNGENDVINSEVNTGNQEIDVADNKFDVTDDEFGAIPNDEKDDYDAINNALKKAREIDETITVYIPAGEYIISKQLYIYSNTKLILDENAVIKSMLSDDMSTIIMGLHNDREDNHGEYSRLQNIEISGGILDRNSSSDIITNAIVLQHGNNINIHDVTIKNCTDHIINISADKDVIIQNVVFKDHIAYTGESKEYWGNHDIGNTERHKFAEAIHTDYAGEYEKGALPLDNTTCQNITIDNCKFDGVLSGVGTHHESDYKATNVTVKNCEFTNIKYGAAIDAWSFDTLNVTNNSLIGSDIGIISVESTGSIINNSFIVTGNSSNYGVIHLENSEFEIKNNTIENASKYAIMISAGSTTISENTINGASGDGIRIDNATSMYINNNIISGIGRYGIFVLSCNEENIIKTNTINSRTGQAGIFIERSGNRNLIEDNTISGNLENDVCLINSDGIINKNILDLSSSNAIQLYNSNSTISLNKITNTGANAIYILNGEATVIENTIDKVSTDGIRADKISKINISGNKIKEATRYGIFITNSSDDVLISSNEVNDGEAISGIYIEKCSGENLIEKNIVKCGTFAGILGFKCNGTISENIVTECKGDALQTMGDSENIATFIITDNILQTDSESNYDIRLNSYSMDCEVNNNILGNRGLAAARDVTYTEIKFTGLKKDVNGIERYYKDGKEDNTTGVIQYNGRKYYIQQGIFRWEIEEFENPFNDIKESSWYHNSVKYVYENGIMTGLNATTFGPSNNLTRGMMVTILYRMEGIPEVTGAPTFPDVQNSNKYYYNAVNWAADKGIVAGYSNGKFGPTDNITRAQLAVILYKYAEYKGKDVSKRADLTEFPDNSQVASWAQNAVKWAIAEGIISGNVNKQTEVKTIDPRQNATRAQVASMMERYCKNIGK